MIKFAIMEGQVKDDNGYLMYHVVDLEDGMAVFSGLRLECELWCENLHLTE